MATKEAPPRTFSPGVILATVAVVVAFGWRALHPAAPSKQPRPQGSGELVAGRPVPPALAGKGELKLAPDAVIVRVNGVPLAAKDVIGFAPDESEKTLARPAFRAALEQAVVRQLIQEEATKQGVSLSEERRVQADQSAAMAAMLAGSVTSKADIAALVLRKKQGESDLLLEDLLTKGGTPPPGPTADDVLVYYRAHAKEFGTAEPAPGTEAWDRVQNEIRVRLMLERQPRWEAQRQVLLDGLRRDAKLVY